MELKNKNIIITGASSGIGRQLAMDLSKTSNIAILARNKNKLDDFAEQLKNNGNKIIPIKCDVTNKKEVSEAVALCENQLGGIDVAILNSGVSHRNPVRNFNSDFAVETINVNFLGIVYMVEALLPRMLKKEKSVLVGISSLAESRGFPQSGFYCASKAAASILLESLRVELKKTNIKVITVKPGFIKTPMTDKNEFKMPFLMEVEKASEIIINGILREKRIIQFPLPTVFFSKLLKIIPDAAYEYLIRLSK